MIYSEIDVQRCFLQWGSDEHLPTPDFVVGQDEIAGHGWRCQNSSDIDDIKCLPRRLACDGFVDCFDHSDEEVGCKVHEGKTTFFEMA